MTRTSIVVLSASAIIGVVAASHAGEDRQAEPSNRTGFALVELFTSEGCSSCPPADQVAANIARRAESQNTPVYVLAFHVDYWDYLGWKDRFASPDYAARQRAYAKHSASERVYTPQMVINGGVEFVGSDLQRATREIDSALASTKPDRADSPPVAITITLDPKPLANLRHTVTYAVAGLDQTARRTAVLHLAVVQSGLASDVARGENAGKRLEHDRVVRWFASTPLADSATGDATIHIPGDADRDRTAIVAWVQAGEVGPVLAATSIPSRR